MRPNERDLKLIGERIKAVRKSKGYTQAKVAEMIDMSDNNFSELERGKMGMSISSLMALCKALGVSSDYLLFGIKGQEQTTSAAILLSQLDDKDRIYAEKLLRVFVESRK